MKNYVTMEGSVPGFPLHIYHFPYSLGKGFELESVMLDCGIKYLRAESACLDHIKKKYSIKRVFYVKNSLVLMYGEKYICT
jgi:hypothetical protein